MSRTILIAGFLGIGKSTFFKKANSLGLTTHDSDSSLFDKSKFPKNYVDYIEKLIKDHDIAAKDEYALISTHDVVRDELDRRGIDYNLVYPNVDCKEEYLQRYKRRGSPEAPK